MQKLESKPVGQGFEIKDFREFANLDQREFTVSIARANYRWLWTFAFNIILGLWLISGPHLFNYRSHGLELSDTIAGALVIAFEFLAFFPRLAQLRWITCLVAVWLMIAPLVFWSPTPAVFLLDTLIGCLLIANAVLIPGLPGRGVAQLEGPDQPPGWTYNPSSWIRRWLGIALALTGFFLARYLAAHQLGYVGHAWDPFFGDGSDRVTGSSVSRSFPVSDAGLGSVVYMLESLSAFMGDRARWRTAPWITVLSACLVIPLGATSIILVVMQPVVVGAWCGLCLVSAVALIASVPLAVHEAIAVGLFLMAAIQQKKYFWRVFWMGGTILGAGAKDPDRMNFSLKQRLIASVQGVNVPWTLLSQIFIGVWLLARPDVLPSLNGQFTANCDHLVGAVVVTIAAIATAEVTRILRLLNLAIGIGLVVFALAFSVHQPAVFCSELVCGIALSLLSIPLGPIAERYGAWDRFVR
ncbi:MAG TPA: vitamin K epoxide reductase family protein [Oculatellaceae cyanobacterium]